MYMSQTQDFTKCNLNEKPYFAMDVQCCATYRRHVFVFRSRMLSYRFVDVFRSRMLSYCLVVTYILARPEVSMLPK